MQKNQTGGDVAGTPPKGASATGAATQPAGVENYVIRVYESVLEVSAAQWDGLLRTQPHPTPFMRHAYLAAMHASGAASAATGWLARVVTLWQDETLAAACPLYFKDHSYGEYVFDWAWANAYEQHGLTYYPKAVIAVPFTPVPGTRLLARSDAARQALLLAALGLCREAGVSSLHLLFGARADLAACDAAGLMQRDTVQFHWQNETPAPDDATPGRQYGDFDGFLASLSQEKRKKIRQERRKVREAGVTFRWARGTDISAADWDFFYRCYERTYLEHGNAPYLNRDFFQRMAHDMADNWLLFIATRDGRPIASSLIAIQDDLTLGLSQNDSKSELLEPGGSPISSASPAVAYGRYWGALERVDCLHFEACYYQPLQWCIAHGISRFEGGAQGEHKMARALLPVKASSAHWLAHPAFADAVGRFLQREGEGVGDYLDHLQARSPLRKGG